jgi:O-antigen/teichoic acid export membrane protein
MKNLQYLNYSNRSKKIFIDIFINLIGTGVPLIALQLFIYPVVAGSVSSEEYGQMQSTMSMVYLLSGTFGGALSTTRLIKNNIYEENKISSDFNILNIFCLLIVLSFTPVFEYVFLRDISLYGLILSMLISALNYSTLYYEVGFRLELDYKSIFINKVLGCLGYLAGFLFFTYYLRWQYIFICSYFFQTVYCIFRTKLIKEPIQKSQFFLETTRSFVDLGIAGMLNKALTYFDKLLLYPLLGGTSVSIYFAANIFGKLILQIIEPVTNVILSYLSKEKEVTKELWKIVIPFGALICVIIYFFCILISRPILSIFYPQWVNEAMKYVPITTFCLAISSYTNILYPFTLKAINSNKQILFNSTGLIVYISLVLCLYKTTGLWGCCFALLTSYIVKLAMIFIFCFFRGEKWINL